MYPSLRPSSPRPDRVGVDVVDHREHVDEVFARASAGVGVERAAHGVRVAKDVAVDEPHHVERRAVDLDVVAEAERRRDGHVGRAERGDDAVLASHVVRGREHVAERRPPEHTTRARSRR